MPRARLPLHARDHRPGGADEITGLGGGDYVFLEEIVVASDGDPLVFTDIDQGYRHLVVELIGATDDVVANGNDPDDLLVSWNAGDDDFAWAQTWLWDGLQVENNTWEAAAIPIRNVLPQSRVGGAGIPAVDGLTMSAATLKFPYYRAAGHLQNMIWQAGGLVLVHDPTNGTSVVAMQSTGVGSYGFTTDNMTVPPITEITLAPATYGWLAGSRASMYGIT